MAEEQEQRKENRPPRAGGRGAPAGSQGGPPRGDRPGGDRPGGERAGGDRDRGERRGFERGRLEGPPEIELEKLISDSLYLDNQAHSIVSRIRDMDSGTKTQLRRLSSAVRRAVRAPAGDR